MVHSLGLPPVVGSVLQHGRAVGAAGPARGAFVPEASEWRRLAHGPCRAWRPAEAGAPSPCCAISFTMAAGTGVSALAALGPGLDSSEAINAQRAAP